MICRTPLLAASVVVLALLACKKQKAEPTETTGLDESSESTGASDTETLNDWDLDAVCNELPKKQAKPYAKKVGEIHPTIVFTRDDSNAKYQKSYSDDFDGWKTDNAADYQLVACVTATSRKKVKDCVFDEEKPVRTLELHSATYEFRVLEAHTGKEVGKKTVDLKADKECPMFWMFKEERQTKDPEFEQALMEFAKAFVAPKG